MPKVSDFIQRARDKWFEPGRPPTPQRDPVGPGEESVWDYPRPPRVEPVSKRVRVELGGRTIADTTRAFRVLETSHPPNYYVPPDDVDRSVLEPAGGGSICEWKGPAKYWTAVVGDRRAERAVWCYPDPFDEFAALAGYFCFYCAPFDACWVGEHRATPQPGGFYGGWVTPEIKGPIKGGPGSSFW